MERGSRRPTAEEVMEKLKDDGDFDSLRVNIIRKVKENEELRSSIVKEVKQSIVLNEEGSEKLKLRELSDAIYQELGKKIMGQISDEVWKVIRSDEMVIRGTVETVYNRLVNPDEKKEPQTSPLKKHQINDEAHVSPLKPSTCETNASDDNEPSEPPGFALTNQPGSNNGKVERSQQLHAHQPQLPVKDLNHTEQIDDVPPGFNSHKDGHSFRGGISDEDPDVPPGFG
ncbi:uncharacterized protein [Typha angustifolia]|uniref:uncharacterized protein n=1 Tax=Typha angustifolia TaxID=59011 RepID=UPI003C2E7AF7